MASRPSHFLTKSLEFYDNVFIKGGDPRMKSRALMASPIPTLLVIIIYILMVKYGPILMQSRKPFQLKWFILPYNAFMVGLSAYMFCECLLTVVFAEDPIFCQATDFNDTRPNTLRMVSVCWLFYFSKIIEMLDTVMLILRKKENQLSLLHVYHHASTVILTWGGVNYFSVGSAYIYVIGNGFIHTIMYSYYGLAALGPHMQKYLGWKRYLTTLQLMQLCIYITSGVVAMLMECDRNLFLYMELGAVNSVILAMFFLHFYRKNYTRDENGERLDKLKDN